ncbi:MAG: hypothetical protein MJZ41_12160 [Bacteroidaceae bacterium]|nr:hypothetical protein [Bacteroidaceae bacterium]
MAAFIVISADNRLHYLVDGIENCRPLNPDVSAEISTGKISKTENEYIYNYTIPGEGRFGDKAKSFSELLSNQLAAFRLAYAIPHDELVNIFFLENPLTEEELEKSESWLEDFDKVFNAGLGHDTNFCLFRILFTYDHNDPTDVNAQIDINALQRILKNHKTAVTFNPEASSEPSFKRYLFYIDNQKSDAAALCLRKDEHDLKMPRILIDFMMLVSNSFDMYNVIAAISPPQVTTRCFSIGYAESMYYYPDVERYYIHADNRDIHYKILTSADEKSEEEGARSMDVEKYPFGLRSRLKRLAVIYEDVPFTDNINNHFTSADYKIDKCIVELRDLLVHEREKEVEDFMNSSEVVSRKKKIENLEEQIEQIKSAKQTEEETVEDFEIRIQQLRASKDKTTEELKQLIRNFEPECPEYISRSDVYTELCVEDDDDRENLLNSRSAHYHRLVNFAKSKKFYMFVKATSVKETEEIDSATDGNDNELKVKEDLSNNSGCSFPSWLLFLRKKNTNNETAEIDKSDAPGEVPEPEDNKLSSTDHITCIKEQLDLKSKFVFFKNTILAIEQVLKDEKKYCDEFKLTTHTNHYFPLINLAELAKKHAETSETRIQESINSWRLEAEPLKSDLLNTIKNAAANHTKKYYLFIDWDNPFSFIHEVSSNLPTICNQLQKRAAPIVNYNLTPETNENKVIRYFFSDRPQFKEEMDAVRSQLDNGNEVTATKSTHIVSKICMFQFLPMDESVLDHLVDLQVRGDDDIDLVGIAQHLPEGSNETDVNVESNTNEEPHVIDWGEH